MIIIGLSICIIVIGLVLRNPWWNYKVIIPFRLSSLPFWSYSSSFSPSLSTRRKQICLLIYLSYLFKNYNLFKIDLHCQNIDCMDQFAANFYLFNHWYPSSCFADWQHQHGHFLYFDFDLSIIQKLSCLFDQIFSLN